MAKKRGPRGKRGLKGKPGRSGKTGPTGHQGLKGAKGKRGPLGRSGTLVRSSNPAMLSGIHKQIENIYKELEIQMKRMAQVQAEVDDVREKLQRLAARSH